MNTVLRSSLLAIAVFAQAAVAADVSRLDHYHPVILNEHAVQKVREGDFGTAAILLERAVLIAPYDARIRHNLATLRAWQAGRLAAEMPDEGMPATGSAPTDDDIAVLPPFPLWQKK